MEPVYTTEDHGAAQKLKERLAAAGIEAEVWPAGVAVTSGLLVIHKPPLAVVVSESDLSEASLIARAAGFDPEGGL
jgi:hypothetical protein